MHARPLAFGVVAALVASPTADACTTQPDELGVSPGLTLGGATAWSAGSGGFLLGGELSLFRLRDNDGEACGAPAVTTVPDYSWIGGYTDVVYDVRSHATRVTLGPELGHDYLGIDGGLVIAHQDGQTRAGLALRPVFALGYVDLYVRYEHMFQAPFGDNLLEVGFLLKWPHLTTTRRH